MGVILEVVATQDLSGFKNLKGLFMTYKVICDILRTAATALICCNIASLTGSEILITAIACSLTSAVPTCIRVILILALPNTVLIAEITPGYHRVV